MSANLPTSPSRLDFLQCLLDSEADKGWELPRQAQGENAADKAKDLAEALYGPGF